VARVVRSGVRGGTGRRLTANGSENSVANGVQEPARHRQVIGGAAIGEHIRDIVRCAMRADHPLVLLRADIATSIETDELRAGWSRRLTVLAKIILTTRLQAVVLFRLGQWAHGRMPAVAVMLKYLNGVITGADIAVQAEIGPGLRLYHPSGVVIGPGCVVGAHCIVMQGATLGIGGVESPQLGDDVFVGPGAVLLGGIAVGDGSIIGANAVLLQSFPPGSFIAGVPAKLVKRT
jgi:serine O-acetyltransferase